jgi:hypothetical protein
MLFQELLGVILQKKGILKAEMLHPNDSSLRYHMFTVRFLGSKHNYVKGGTIWACLVSSARRCHRIYMDGIHIERHRDAL